MIKLFPAIDIIDGRCVRLSQGDYARTTVYADDPVAMARRFAEAGIGRLHLVDLDGAKASEPRNLDVLRRVRQALPQVRVEWGGGIKSEAALSAALEAGAEWVVCGSVAATQPELFAAWLQTYGPRLVLGADVKDGLVATHGWLRASAFTVEALIGRFPGLQRVVCTDVARDGMLCSPSTQLYADLQRRFPDVEVTVSGGVSSADDLRALARAGLRSAIVGKAFYEGRISLDEMARLDQPDDEPAAKAAAKAPAQH